ncbi:hypothetical protein XH93_10435 [Bradyrhizobium sp. CCBAU 51753]|nr:hypothetical protein XH93_10435 [Bradyrhizobium sp. CCBAU 51753]
MVFGAGLYYIPGTHTCIRSVLASQ